MGGLAVWHRAKSALVVAPVVGQRARWLRMVRRIRDAADRLAPETDAALRERSDALRRRANGGELLDGLLPDAYALVRESARRELGFKHHDVQILAGIAMHFGSIAQMATGEGKTLSATLPLYLHGLPGRGVHVATANDYLARRDCEWMGPVLRRLGLTVDFIEANQAPERRRESYQADITYAAAKELGFDYLRDRLQGREREQDLARRPEWWGVGKGGEGEGGIQRTVPYALIDEADSLLIDEARTPLIISAGGGTPDHVRVVCFRWSAAAAGHCVEEEHFTYDQRTKAVDLKPAGRQVVRALAKPPELSTINYAEIYEYVERAILAARDFLPDRQYVVRDGEIVIVDEFTGRLGEGRKWNEGLHQAVEAKEGLNITLDTRQAARILAQSLFCRYPLLGGMTGTAEEAAGELRRIYKVKVVPIPTHRQVRRIQLPSLVLGTSQARWQAIVEEVQTMRDAGRPVLIGTRSIDKSEILSQLLTQAGLDHEVLNARNLPREAEIVARAGEAGRITVATNMAGRGTDIKLAPEVSARGGLHVVASELNESARIDRQLFGRCGRQGDPGSCRQFLSLEDEILLAGLGEKKAKALARHGRDSAGPFATLESEFHRAQTILERRHSRHRFALLHQERERQRSHRELGQDPLLDWPE